MRGWIAPLVVAVALVMVAGLAVIAVVVGADGRTALVDLEPGDCLELSDDEAEDGTIDEVDVIDCAEPHLAEVVLVGTLNEGDEPYPSDEELFAAVDLACRRAGVVDSDDFGLLPVAPTLELWQSFEGRFLCIAVPFGGVPVTGSLAAD